MLQRLHIKSLLADRGYLIGLIAMLLLVLGITLLSIGFIRPGELRVPVRYSRFDLKNYSLEQWYHLLNYFLFAAIVWVGHFLISAKLYQAKGRQFAMGCVWIGIAILVITTVYLLSIIKVVSLTQ